jgi:hypothetical protein
MSTALPAFVRHADAARQGLLGQVAVARRGHRGLFGFAVAMAVLVPVLAVLTIVDDRVLLGVPIWIKPLKFAVSFVAYAGSLAWLLGQLQERTMRRVGWLIVAVSAVEMAIIVGQAARGVRSHFNDDTPFDAALFSVMGATIVVLWFATLAVALRFLHGATRSGPVAGRDSAAQSPDVVPPEEPGRDRAAGAAVRLGLFVALVGLLEGFVMVANGAHTIGLADGGPGLPLVGWSTTGGDLRIAHFIGMHALQGLPLLAAALAATGRLDEHTRVHIVRIAAAAWTGLVVLLTAQALRAQPLLAPDALTLTAAAALVLGTGAAVVTVLTRRRSHALVLSA